MSVVHNSAEEPVRRLDIVDVQSGRFSLGVYYLRYLGNFVIVKQFARNRIRIPRQGAIIAACASVCCAWGWDGGSVIFPLGLT